MARPVLIPREETMEDNYLRLERLLCELFLVLRALFAGDNHEPPPEAPHFYHHPPPPPNPPAAPGQGPAPGGSRPSQSAAPRRPYPTSHRHPSDSTSSGSSTTPKSANQRLYWVNLGRQLRDIADDFKSSRAQPLTLKKLSSPSKYYTSLVCHV